MVTHYPTPIASNDGFRLEADAHQAEDGIGVRVLLRAASNVQAASSGQAQIFPLATTDPLSRATTDR